MVFIDREMVLKNKQLAENLELVRMTKNYSDSFSKMAGKHQILGYRIPNTDLGCMLSARRVSGIL